MFRLLCAAVLALVATLCVGVTGAGALTPPTRYYLALGDSLSQGMQPDVFGVTRNTDEGYANQLYIRLARRMRSLELVKLGCGGESTESMISGHGNDHNAKLLHCDRAGGSQLSAAVRFLRAHHAAHEVPVVTIDIGANDVDGCAVVPTGEIASCVSKGEAHIKHDLPIILRRLRRAAPKGTILTGMTLYDPVLAGYFSASSTARSLATASIAFLRQVNGLIAGADVRAGFRTADVAGAFDSYDTKDTVAFDGAEVPVDVARVCSWTWACTPPPSGPNIHANKNGYAVIATTFLRAIRGSG